MIMVLFVATTARREDESQVNRSSLATPATNGQKTRPSQIIEASKENLGSVEHRANAGRA